MIFVSDHETVWKKSSEDFACAASLEAVNFSR